MAKFAEKPEAELVAEEPVVAVRVTKKGDGKISTGKHVAMLGDELYEAGEEFSISRSIALELEDRGFVEIQAAKAVKGAA